MTADEFLLLLFGCPIAALIGGWLGRKYQRYAWRLDRPYEERVRALKGRRG